MKSMILLPVILMTLASSSQTHQLKLTKAGKNDPVFIKEGDKVLMAIKMPRHLAAKKPANVYSLTGTQLADSVYVFTKGRIWSINDSSILMRERNSFFSVNERRIRIEKINTLRKLGAGKQFLRTTTTVGSGLAIGATILYSYVSTSGNCEGCIESMFLAAGTAAVGGRFGRTRIAKKHLDNWKIEVVTMP